MPVYHKIVSSKFLFYQLSQLEKTLTTLKMLSLGYGCIFACVWIRNNSQTLGK